MANLKAIVFKPAAEAAFAMFSRMTESDAVKAATEGLNSGAYVAKVVTPALENAEAVFDYINLESKACASMNPGDVIVWENGKRELCLSVGWSAI